MSYMHTEYKFGAKSIREIDGPYSLATGVIEYDDSFIIITTPGDLFRFESNKFSSRFYYKFVATSYSRNNNVLFGITDKPSTIVAISLSEVGRPIIKGYPIAQNNVKRVFYFEKSKTLVVIGDSVRCYGVFFDPVLISLDNTFEVEILSDIPTIADFENEVIYLKTKEGYSAYELNGVISEKSFFLDSIEYYSREIVDGLIFNSENIIFLLNNNIVNVVNIKTKKNFEIIQFPDKANRVFLASENNIALSFDGKITFYEISIFWKTWVPSISSPSSIKRFNKDQSAARILVQGENSCVYFMSPRDGLEIAKIEPQDQDTETFMSNTSKSVSYFYDRGYYVYTQYKGSTNSHAFRVKETTRRERFFIISKEGDLIIYNTNNWPFEEISRKSINAKSVTICKFEENWNYLISTSKNELIIMNPKTLEIGQKFQVTGPPVLYTDYYYPTNVVLLIREYELTFYDLKKDFPLCRTTVNKFTALKFNGEILYLGFENGFIERVSMNNRALKSKDRVKAHDAPISDFAFSSSFWLSSAEDGTIFAWDYKLHAIISKIYLPIQINCLCVINGHKDVVVGVENAIMLLDREIFFTKNKKDEKESKIIDSYDTIKDRFVPISSQDPARPNQFTTYPIHNGLEPSNEFPVSIFTFGSASQSVGIHSPRRNPNTQSARTTRSPRNFLAKSVETNVKNENEEYDYDKYDYIEYDEENNNAAKAITQDVLDDVTNNIDINSNSNYDIPESIRFDEEDNNNDGNDDNDTNNFFANNTYNANCPISNSDISDSEEFAFDDFNKDNFNKDYSQPVASTPMLRPRSRNPQAHRIIPSPLLTDGPVENIDKGDSLFANTQPDSGMPVTEPAPMTITKSMRVFADDADSDSDNDEFFKERFPLRSRNSLYIESTRKKRRIPYIPIPTDLYETTKPLLKPHAKIITPKPETPKRKPALMRV